MSGRSVVAVVSCLGYDRTEVAEAVREGFSLLGEESVAKVLESQPLLLKPNLLLPAPPEKGVTTHPAVFGAVARHLLGLGARMSWGDSPNGVYRPEPTARRSGLLDEARAIGIPMEDFDVGTEAPFPGGVQNRRFAVACAALRAGAIVSLPRLKTHGSTVVTGALKNSFGLVTGNHKMQFHLRHPGLEDFSRMLVDLNAFLPSRLVVLDAIRVMEGNGPSAGTLVDMGLLVFSTDPVAADAVGCRILGIDPLSIPVIRLAEERGLGTARDLELRGVDLSRRPRRALKIPPRSPAVVPAGFASIAKRVMTPKPVIDSARCIACGKCVETCPTTPKAVTQARPKTVPRHDYGLCIRCYCCQEICPEGAITLRPTILGRLLVR